MTTTPHEHALHYLQWAQLAIAQDRLELAGHLLEKSLRLNPGLPEARLVEARLHLRHNRGQHQQLHQFVGAYK